METKKSLTIKDLDALPDGTRIVVTLAGRSGRRQTRIGDLWRYYPAKGGEPRFQVAVDGFVIALLKPGDGPDEDFVVMAEGGKR